MRVIVECKQASDRKGFYHQSRAGTRIAAKHNKLEVGLQWDSVIVSVQYCEGAQVCNTGADISQLPAHASTLLQKRWCMKQQHSSRILRQRSVSGLGALVNYIGW